MAKQNVTPEQFAAALLRRLHIRQTPGALRAVVGWERAEGGHWNNDARFNPLNTTQPEPGAGNTGSQGNIKVYKSWDQGLHATVQTLRNGRYGGILNALKKGNPGAVGSAIAQSPWGTGSLAARTIAATPAVKGVPTSGLPSSSRSGGGGGSPGSRTIPGVSRESDRRAVILNYLSDPALHDKAGAGLLQAIVQSKAIQDTPAKTVTVKAHARAPASPQVPSEGGGVGQPGGLATMDGKPVDKWIAARLQRARKAGWTGTVSSGYRSDAEQTRIYKSGVRPAAIPQSMGGKGSNHEFKAYPGGAVDVTNAAQLNAVLRKLGIKKLVYAGSKDPVHFSHPHGGSY